MPLPSPLRFRPATLPVGAWKGLQALALGCGGHTHFTGSFRGNAEEAVHILWTPQLVMGLGVGGLLST